VYEAVKVFPSVIELEGVTENVLIVGGVVSEAACVVTEKLPLVPTGRCDVLPAASTLHTR
jgi:hypothetical protein